MLYFLLWIGLSVAVGMLATQRNRGSGTWFLVSVLFSPLLGVIFLFASPNLKTSTEAAEQANRVKCPACAEWVQPEASVCKHCGGALVPDPGFAYRAQLERETTTKAAQDSLNLKVGAALAGLIVLVYFLVSSR